MSLAELHNRIHCWLWLYERMPLTRLSEEMAVKVNRSISITPKRELMEDVAEFHIPSELRNTPVAVRLKLAMEYANTGDYSKLSYIADLLKKVNTAIATYSLKKNNGTFN